DVPCANTCRPLVRLRRKKLSTTSTVAVDEPMKFSSRPSAPRPDDCVSLKVESITDRIRFGELLLLTYAARSDGNAMVLLLIADVPLSPNTCRQPSLTSSPQLRMSLFSNVRPLTLTP